MITRHCERSEAMYSSQHSRFSIKEVDQPGEPGALDE